MALLVWLITGSSSGFGQEIAVQALKRGDKVIAAAREVSKLEKLKEAGAEVIALDVTSDAILLKETASTAHGFYGKIDILVNCAGYNAAGAVEECSPDEVLASFNTNVFGLMAVTRAIIPYMRAQKSGTIANFSSTMAWTGAGGQALYSGVKAATSVISECLSAELKPWNISVISIEPGSFRTDFLADGHLTLPKAPLKEYDGTPARQVIEYMGYFDGKQPGEVVKGSRIVVDVLTKSGSAVGREIPMRLALGPDAYDTIKGKCEQTMVLLDEWKVISTATNHADVEASACETTPESQREFEDVPLPVNNELVAVPGNLWPGVSTDVNPFANEVASLALTKPAADDWVVYGHDHEFDYNEKETSGVVYDETYWETYWGHPDQRVMTFQAWTNRANAYRNKSEPVLSVEEALDRDLDSYEHSYLGMKEGATHQLLAFRDTRAGMKCRPWYFNPLPIPVRRRQTLSMAAWSCALLNGPGPHDYLDLVSTYMAYMQQNAMPEQLQALQKSRDEYFQINRRIFNGEIDADTLDWKFYIARPVCPSTWIGASNRRDMLLVLDDIDVGKHYPINFERRHLLQSSTENSTTTVPNQPQNEHPQDILQRLLPEISHFPGPNTTAQSEPQNEEPNSQRVRFSEPPNTTVQSQPQNEEPNNQPIRLFEPPSTIVPSQPLEQPPILGLEQASMPDLVQAPVAQGNNWPFLPHNQDDENEDDAENQGNNNLRSSLDFDDERPGAYRCFCDLCNTDTFNWRTRAGELQEQWAQDDEEAEEARRITVRELPNGERVCTLELDLEPDLELEDEDPVRPRGDWFGGEWLGPEVGRRSERDDW